MTKTHIRKALTLLGMLGMSAGLAACGGGGGGGGSLGAGSSPATSVGAMTKGSAIVNGVRFAVPASTVIRIDDNNAAHVEAELRDGMEVKVKGVINDDRLTGQAEKIEVEPEVRGALGGKGLDDFTVHGQRVITDDGTVFEDRLSATSFGALTFAALADGEKVEVHGGRDDLGNIRATRVERRNDNPPDDIKGIVTDKLGTVISIGSFSIDIAGVQTSPAGATINVGDLVEVHLNAAGTAATLVDLEDLEDLAEGVEPAEGMEFEVEGFVSGFTSHPGSFRVGNDNVQTTSATRFENGVAADLANGVKVEAEGHKTNGVLVAEKISFRDSIRIEANADAGGSASVLGKTVKTTSGTELGNLASVAAILAGDGLKIRGFLNPDNTTITATRVDKLGNPVNANQIILQGVVSAFNATAGTMTIAGLTVDASGAAEFRAFDESLIGRTAFFNSLTADRTVVKARGSFAGSTLTADKAEIEKP